MSEREKALQLLDRVPDYKLKYVIAFLQWVAIPESKPNAVTINAMQKLENGGGESFDNLNDLWSSLEG